MIEGATSAINQIDEPRRRLNLRTQTASAGSRFADPGPPPTCAPRPRPASPQSDGAGRYHSPVQHLVLTIIGDDRPGIVSALADTVATHGGNWERSQLARLRQVRRNHRRQRHR